MHFTYSVPTPETDLRQGDVVAKTPGIDEILKAVHPWYNKPANRYFIVLTQDCDLVRRDGINSDSRYISLSPVRALSALLRRQIGSFAEDGFPADFPVCTDRSRGRLQLFLERIYNNNEPGYFFLRREPTHQFPDDCCAFLALTITIKADLHYKTCLDARILSLKDSFRAKLGWLIGQLYSRIGTEDWPASDLRNELSAVLNGTAVWIPERRKALLRTLVQNWNAANPGQSLTQEAIDELMKQLPKKKDQVVARTLDLLTQTGALVAQDRPRAENLLRNDTQLSDLLKE